MREGPEKEEETQETSAMSMRCGLAQGGNAGTDKDRSGHPGTGRNDIIRNRGMCGTADRTRKKTVHENRSRLR